MEHKITIADTEISVEIYTEGGEKFIYFGTEDGSGCKYPANSRKDLMSAFGHYIDNYVINY